MSVSGRNRPHLGHVAKYPPLGELLFYVILLWGLGEVIFTT